MSHVAIVLDATSPINAVRHASPLPVTKIAGCLPIQASAGGTTGAVPPTARHKSIGNYSCQHYSLAMTPALYILLAIGTETRHGYGIMREIRDATGGRVEILPGTLYATIKTLLADELIQEVAAPKDADSGDARRRYYRVTRAGRSVAAAQTEQMAALVKLGRPFLKGAR